MHILYFEIGSLLLTFLCAGARPCQRYFRHNENIEKHNLCADLSLRACLEACYYRVPSNLESGGARRYGKESSPPSLARSASKAAPIEGSIMSSSLNPALDASVLVLNKLFMAIHIISVRRAFCLLCKELAEVVSLEDGQFATYDFNTWREVSEYRARYFRQED